MSEYGAIEKEARIYTELCEQRDRIDPALFDRLGVKRGPARQGRQGRSDRHYQHFPHRRL